MNELIALLKAISAGNYEYWQLLSEDKKKQYAPYVLMKWLSGSTPEQILKLQNANRWMFVIQDRDTQVKLLCLSGVKNSYFQWHKLQSGTANNKVLCSMISSYYGCSQREAKEYLDRHTNKELSEMAESLGYDKEEQKKIDDILKKR